MNTLRALFDELVALPAAERGRFLAERAIDPALREQIERLLVADLAADEDGATGERRSALAIAQAIGDSEPLRDIGPGSRIGPFMLRERLGEGGSSIVYRAERTLDGITQTVALKLLHRSLLSLYARRQFDRERRALAQLRHPDIARLIEGGVGEGGLAYLALELVDGRPITEHASAEVLPLRARLRLFLATCRAVEAAHNALIVHRDLKPANVLVTRDGHVKLVDFGIAKWLHELGTDPTRTLQRAFTPAYGAPEQRDGGPITTATDVYALGVMLGELLTGQRLNTGNGLTPSGSITAETPAAALPAPPRQLRRLLRGDLDNIVLKAIAPEPQRRYPNAGALADDVQRLLDGRPVHAHPPSRWYVLQKFVARHRGSVAVTALLLLSTFAGLATATWQSVVARREAALAAAAAARADSMREFMFETFAEAEPVAPRKGPMTVLEATERAWRIARDDAKAEPRARLELLARLAEVLDRQGDIAGAVERLQFAANEATRLIGPDDPLTLEIEILLTNVIRLHGNYAEARRRYDELLLRVPEHATLLRTRLLRGSATLAARPENDRARSHAEMDAALALARSLGPDELLAVLRNRAVTLIDLNETPAAIPAFEEQLVLLRERYGEKHEKLATALAALGRAYRRIGELERSQELIEAAVAMDREIFPGDHWITANHLNALSLTQDLRGDFTAALSAAGESLRIGQATLGASHHETLISMGVYAALLSRVGRHAEALAQYRVLLASAAPELLNGRNGLYWRGQFGAALALAGDTAAATAELDRALVGFAALVPPSHDHWAKIIEKRLLLALDRGDRARAELLCSQLEQLAARVDSTDPFWPGRIATVRGELLLAQGRAPEALGHLNAAMREIDPSIWHGRALQIDNLLLRAQATAALGDTATARELVQQGRTLLVALQSPPPRLTARAERSAY